MENYTIKIVNCNDERDFTIAGIRREGRVSQFVELMETRINSDYKIVVKDFDGNDITDEF